MNPDPLLSRANLEVYRICAHLSCQIYAFIEEPFASPSLFSDPPIKILEYLPDHTNGNTPHVIARHERLHAIFVVFRGTRDVWDRFKDLCTWPESTPIGDLHSGVAKSVYSFFTGAQDALQGYIDDFPGDSFVFTGHSLGGAVAAAAAGFMRLQHPEVGVQAVAFGPLAGFDRYAWMRSREYCTTFVIKGDEVPMLGKTQFAHGFDV
jgi:hypothetical protein